MTDTRTFRLHVDEKHLDSGVHEYMACFTAECTFRNSRDPLVEIATDCELPDFAHQPHDDDKTKTYLASVLSEIERGITYALVHRRHGLRVVISELRLHPIDYQPRFLMLHTYYYYTRRQLEILDDQ